MFAAFDLLCGCVGRMRESPEQQLREREMGDRKREIRRQAGMAAAKGESKTDEGRKLEKSDRWRSQGQMKQNKVRKERNEGTGLEGMEGSKAGRCFSSWRRERTKKEGIRSSNLHGEKKDINEGTGDGLGNTGYT